MTQFWTVLSKLGQALGNIESLGGKQFALALWICQTRCLAQGQEEGLPLWKQWLSALKWEEQDENWKRCLTQHSSRNCKVTVIVDCFEVFIDRPSNLLARAQTFSSYKHHNTAKLLIGITPQGTISFVSDSWRGRTSDKCLTQNCSILGKLLPGDLILADQGFTVQESVLYHEANINIPAFIRGKINLIQLMLKRSNCSHSC